MSAYSDWKSGAITDDQYRQAYMMDRGEDHGEEPEQDEGLITLTGKEYFDMVTAKDTLSLLIRRPCEACSLHTDTGCTRWSCSFDKVLMSFDDRRGKHGGA